MSILIGRKLLPCIKTDITFTRNHFLGDINKMKLLQRINTFALLTLSTIYGISASADADQIEILGGTCNPAYGGSFRFENSYDNNPSTFYHASNGATGWAQYNIPESTVTKVRLQNRGDCCGTRMTNNVVEVCTGDGSAEFCETCGTVTETIGIGQWAEILCGGGISGTIVKVRATNSYLQIAEIEIFGFAISASSTTTPELTTTTTTTTPESTTTTSTTTTTTTLLGVEELIFSACASSPVKDYTRACFNMFEGSSSRDVKAGFCFVTQSKYKGWVDVHLRGNAMVSRIEVLSKRNGEFLSGTVVRVCKDSRNNCREFGRIEEVKKDDCKIMKSEAIEGNMVRLLNIDSGLVICEMKIFGIMA